jgi:hypothetical protein
VEESKYRLKAESSSILLFQSFHKQKARDPWTYERFSNLDITHASSSPTSPESIPHASTPLFIPLLDISSTVLKSTCSAAADFTLHKHIKQMLWYRLGLPE